MGVVSATVTVVVGNPKAGSRTLAVAELTGARYAEVVGAENTPLVLDLARLAPGLLAPWSLSADATDAVAAVRSAQLVVLAAPTYKASFPGVLKLLLDTLPAGSLAGAVVLTISVAGGDAHRHAVSTALAPVLAELGAQTPAQPLELVEAELPFARTLLEAHAERFGPAVAAAVLGNAVRPTGG